MNKKIYVKSDGFAALLAVICLSVFLLALCLQLTNTGWQTRFRLSAIEAKAQSLAAAHSCSNFALASFLADARFDGASSSTIDESVCGISHIKRHSPESNQVTITVRSVVQNQVTTLETIFTLHDIRIDNTPAGNSPVGNESPRATFSSWRELPE